jgi:hypothetical protein
MKNTNSAKGCLKRVNLQLCQKAGPCPCATPCARVEFMKGEIARILAENPRIARLSAANAHSD